MPRVTRLLMVLLILSLGIGSSSAALACAEMPMVKAAAMPMPGCPDQPKTDKNDHATACALMCAAIPAPSALAMRPLLAASTNDPQRLHAMMPWSARPEPPPPRVA